MTVVLWLGALAALWMLGASALVAGGIWPESGPERIISAFAAGSLVVSLVGTLLAVMDFPLRLVVFYAAGLLLLAAALLRRARDRGASSPAGPAIKARPRSSRGRHRAHRYLRSLAAATVLVAWVSEFLRGTALVGRVGDLGIEGQDPLPGDGLPASLGTAASPYAYAHLDYPVGVPLGTGGSTRTRDASIPPSCLSPAASGSPLSSRRYGRS